MKRRSFLKGAAGLVTAASGFSRIAEAQPCPPPDFGDTNVACGVTTSTLSEVAASLGPGQSIEFIPNTLQNALDIQWQITTVFYDVVRREIQYMGKPATSQSNQYSHYMFVEASNSWRAVARPAFTGSGHVWCYAFDPSTGDYYATQYSNTTLRRYRRQTDRWESLARDTSGDLQDGGLFAPIFGWHPNLFGPGKPGLYAHATFYGLAWNPETNAWSRITAGSWSNPGPFRNKNNGVAIYLPGSDRLAIWGKSQASTPDNSVVWVEAGAGLSSDIVGDGLISSGGKPPILINGAGGTTRHGHIVAHPMDVNRLLCLEEYGSDRVWSSVDDGSTWTLESFKHPFANMRGQGEEFTCGTIPSYGVLIGITSDTSGGQTVLWKPNT